MTMATITNPVIVDCVYPVQVGGEPSAEHDHAAALLAHLERLIEAECRDSDEKEPWHTRRGAAHKSDTAWHTHGLRRMLEKVVRPIDTHRLLNEAHADGVRIWFDDHQRLCFHALAAAHEKWAKQISDNRDDIAIALAGRIGPAGYSFERLDLSDRARKATEFPYP